MNSVTENQKKVLIIAYYFPPLGMGGVQRVSKFIKYLPSFGWEPLVLTVKDIDYFSQDASLLQELAEKVKIQRTGSFDPLRLTFLFKRLFKRKKNTTSREKKVTYFHSSIYRLTDLFSFPDNKMGWFPLALIKGLRLCKQGKIDLLFSTSPPLTCHLIGLFLKKFTGIKWIADYRDPYITYRDENNYSLLKRLLLKILQRYFLKNVDGIVTVNQTISEELERIYSLLRVTEVIANSFDQADFEIEVSNRKDIFRIVYFGTFSPDCPADPFLKALQNLLEKYKINRSKIKFTHVGVPIGMDLEKLIREYGLNDVVELKGYFPHIEGIAELLNSDLALLSVAESATGITTGKIFEYLGAKKPILAIVPPEGEAAKLIKSLGAGRVVSPGEIAEIEGAILSFYSEFEKGESFLRTFPEEAKQYEKKQQTSKLAQFFHKIIEE